ncbi:hypothetical protein F383_05837 [Gossypium arboreum]|uniref:Uncharacterized protein n=1 Tax=Gossypium arboreum TaxID=29729 RepID=A0A0B0NTE4_GOSAR|nr:hypothetical protein F383_05837 [Gossypium arboreum]
MSWNGSLNKSLVNSTLTALFCFFSFLFWGYNLLVAYMFFWIS